ncbi:MAG: amino-acid N-acetyltransferase, partial [Alkalimonas sp.]|nr:amino-acid N-acetyltransferase [Alkalimonas sp.]
GSVLLKYVIQRAKQQRFHTLFALTTRSIHWFLEHGFELATVEDLPAQKQQLYNYQRKSKVLALALN